MNLQAVCRGRIPGHLLLWLCRSESESTTGRVGTHVAVRLWDCTSQSRQARAKSEGKNRLFDSEINLYRLLNDILPLATLSRRGAQCAPGQRKIIRFVGEHSDSLRAACGGCSLDAHCGGCVRPTVQPVQMNLQTVCRGRTSGHLLLRLCRNSPWHTLRDRLYRPKNIFSELTTHGQFFI